MDEARDDVTELEAAVEALYAVFVQPLPDVMDYCGHCDDAVYEEMLHEPVRTLPPGLVDKYVHDAMHHTGDEDDFRHFVPRVLELASTASLPYIDQSLLLSRFTAADWSAWAPLERDATVRVLAAMWDDLLATDPPRHEVEDLLCGLGLAFGDLAPLLDDWAADGRLPARRRLRDLILGNASSLARGEPPSDSFWTYNDGGVVAQAATHAWVHTLLVHESLLAGAEQGEPEERHGFEVAARLALDPTSVDEDEAVAAEADAATRRPWRPDWVPGFLEAGMLGVGGATDLAQELGLSVRDLPWPPRQPRAARPPRAQRGRRRWWWRR